MTLPEQGSGWLPLDDYRPESTAEMKLYTGSDMPIPSRDIITDDLDFGWLSVFNADHTLYIFNVILKECPESYCQVQVLPNPKKYTHRHFFVEKNGEEMPEDDVETIINQAILPSIADEHAKMN